MSQREKVEALAIADPVVKHFLGLHRFEGMSYEQALESIVLALAERNKLLLDDAVQVRQRGLPPIIITAQGAATLLAGGSGSGGSL